MKQTIVKTKAQLEKYSENQLYNEIMSMSKTVNSRLRRLRKSNVEGLDNVTYYQINYDVANKASGILSGDFATSGGFLKKPSKKATKQQLIIQYLQYQKMYNFKLTKKETLETAKEIARKTNVSLKAVKTVLSVQRKGFIEELFRIYGSIIFKIINNKMNAGQSYDDVIKLLEYADKSSESVEEVFNKFSGEGVWLL